MAKLKHTKAKNRSFYVSWLSAILSGVSLGVLFLEQPTSLFQVIFLFLLWGILVPAIIYVIGFLIIKCSNYSHFEYALGFVSGYLATYALGIVFMSKELLKYPSVFIFVILTIIVSFFFGLYVVSKIKRT